MYTLRSERRRAGGEMRGVLLLLSDSRLSNDFGRLILSLCWGRMAKAMAIDQGHPVYSGKKAKETTSGTARETNLAKAAAARLLQRVSPFRCVWSAYDTCLLFAALHPPQRVSPFRGVWSACDTCLLFAALHPPQTWCVCVCVEGQLRLVRDLAENVCLQVFRKISWQIL